MCLDSSQITRMFFLSSVMKRQSVGRFPSCNAMSRERYLPMTSSSAYYTQNDFPTDRMQHRDRDRDWDLLASVCLGQNSGVSRVIPARRWGRPILPSPLMTGLAGAAKTSTDVHVCCLRTQSTFQFFSVRDSSASAIRYLLRTLEH